MSIANTDINRRPTHPGEMLREDFLPDYDLTLSLDFDIYFLGEPTS